MTELEVLRITCQRLEKLGIQYMLTGSFAMAYYATPRMTRDLDLVVALGHEAIGPLVEDFSRDFYVDAAAARAAVSAERLFNLMHLESGIKIDLIVRKNSEYRRVEFDRRKRVNFAGTDIWITSCEDLILSKLVWARETQSELQRRDVRALLEGSPDMDYLEKWAASIGVLQMLHDART